MYWIFIAGNVRVDIYHNCRGFPSLEIVVRLITLFVRKRMDISMAERFNTGFSIEPARSQLLNRLWDFQLRHSYISDDAVESLASAYQVSAIEIEGAISFYHFFHRKPAGEFTIYINNSAIAGMKGYERIKEAFEHETGAALNSIDRTGTFGLFTTPCVGLSDHEPAALINFFPFTDLNVVKVKEIVAKLKQGKRPEDLYHVPEDHIRYVPANDRTIFFGPYEAGQALTRLINLSAESVIEQLRVSALSGRGGAFYPTWKKWEACRKQPGATKFIICNADEGEPGTFKDRVLMHNQPGSLIEGMIIAAYTVGAAYGIIYLRGEYAWLKTTLEKTIDLFYEKGWLGKNAADINGFDFDIRIQMGAGSYVCGEETALLESLEGKRGEPRTKWFYPTEKGYLLQPTVVNNVETFCAVSRLLSMGSFEYLKRGIPGSPGTKLISVSGDCTLPGIYEIEWGMTVAELLDRCGADDPYYLQLSGPSGECISMKEKYRRISMLDVLQYTDVRCGGSFMVFNSHRDIVKILLKFSSFFMNESCGICTPCRAGNYIIYQKLERLNNGLAGGGDLEDLKNWGNLMKATSRCGLGRTACNTLMLALEKFPECFASRFKTVDEYNKKFDLEGAVAPYEKYKP